MPGTHQELVGTMTNHLKHTATTQFQAIAAMCECEVELQKQSFELLRD